MPNLNNLIEKYHWLQLRDDGVLEMFLDHHSLQSFRQCEAYFELSILANIAGKHRNWNLTFGILYHELLEVFYKHHKAGTFEIGKWFTHAAKRWDELEMDYFKEHKMFKTLGGLMGFQIMLGQYATHFSEENERLRLIGVEISFGKKREVPLGEFEGRNVGVLRAPNKLLSDHIIKERVRCYLTGRIDFLMDSGSAIGPMDHKTTANFMGKNPANSYDPQEGMTGYIYATNKILENQFPELTRSRKCDRVWMSFAQVTPTKEAHERFKRVPIFKTNWQLEEYRLRQLSTFSKIYDMVVQGRRPDWNTAICNNMFHAECPYRNLHRQNTNDGMLQVLKSDFIVQQEWNPEKIEGERKEVKDAL